MPQPIDPHMQELFGIQIAMQCEFVVRANNEIARQLRLITSDDRVERKEAGTQIWYSVQALLTATANISKALWGQSGRFADERAPLRAALEVDDSSPLKPTSMRNNYDHFDERLTAWRERSTQGNSVDLFIGDVSTQIGGIPDNEMFRSLDPASGDLVFWGDRYNVPEIVNEVIRIRTLAEKLGRLI